MRETLTGRRDFLKHLGGGALAVSAAALAGAVSAQAPAPSADTTQPIDKRFPMTYRPNRHGEPVSLLGYGCMRLPTRKATDGAGDEIDQDRVNLLTDYALEHGVNYFDTSPAYCRGRSERAMGIALSRHPRSSYNIATKLSNFNESQWPREESLKIYHRSFELLQVDTIDYMLLHGIGMGGMAAYNGRYIDNGILDFLVAEREAGRIRNLGFSYHGDLDVFMHALNSDIQWDFVQIQMNYLDWSHAKRNNPRNTNAEFLYEELTKRGIPVVIMEPLLGGRLANVSIPATRLLKALDPQVTSASWALRFNGSHPNVMTQLSGMTYMEHLEENLQTLSPLKPLTEHEFKVLEQVALTILDLPFVQCNSCQYCMPCPYGLDIPAIFVHYNTCLNESRAPANSQAPNYRKARREFLIDYNRAVPKPRQADHCVACKLCIPHCPQRIDIPKEMLRISKYIETLKRDEGHA